jgi:hypothetical protein
METSGLREESGMNVQTEVKISHSSPQKKVTLQLLNVNGCAFVERSKPSPNAKFSSRQ